MTFSTLKNVILNRIPGTRSTLQQAATRHWTLHPPELQLTPAAVYLKDDLLKITDVEEHTSLEVEMRKIRGGPVEHAATTAYELRDAELIHGTVTKGAFTLKLTPQRRRLLSPAPPRTKQPCALGSTYFGSIYFGHWLTDDLTLHLAAESLAMAVATDRQPYRHEPGYCRLLGIPQQKTSTALFSQLIILDDIGQNSHKRHRYRELRSRLRRQVDSGPNRLIYIRRGTSGAAAARKLVNARQVEAPLASQGFAIVDPDIMSAEQITAAIAGARIVVGVEGSHMLHALYAIADDARICVIQPPYRFVNVIKDYADCLDIRYGFTVGDLHPEGFTVPIPSLMEVLSRLDSIC